MDTAHKVIVLLATICHRIYKVTLSPLFGNACRYSPCCSDYALEAVTLHGIRLGAWLGIKRVCRCHPWHAGGLDPVPRQLNKVRIETK